MPGGITGVVTDLFRRYVSGRNERVPVAEESDDVVAELDELTASADTVTSGAKP